MLKLDPIKQKISSLKNTWLITGVAGFIGSHLLETLLNLNQNVIGIDNFSAGSRENLLDVERSIKKSLK
jgi:UDP-N-acetylglucosamine 4-epimerase